MEWLCKAYSQMIPQDELSSLQKIKCDVQMKPHIDSSDPTSKDLSTIRLENEFLNIESSESVKNGDFSIRLENNDFFDWIVEIFHVDTDSKLHEDLQKLQNKTGKGIQLRFKFGKDYPLNPPRMEILEPDLECKINFS